MKKYLLLFSVFIACFIISCNSEDIFRPEWSEPNILDEAYPMNDASLNAMEGIYTVTTDAGGQFGSEVVVKHTGPNQLSVFSGPKNSYIIFSIGSLDSVIIAQGVWRDVTSDYTGLINFYIGKDEGGIEIMEGITPQKLIIRGNYANSNQHSQSYTPDMTLTLEYKRPFSEKVKNSSFYILGHRAGGRTSDRMPHSENSIEMVKYTSGLGTTGIEIDIQLTKDNIPVIYHDPDINIRLTTKGPIFGPIGNFTLYQLENYVRLIHGEKIPTLQDILDFVIDSTDLRFVWLDMKNDDYDISVRKVQQVMPIQKAAMQKAKEKGRDLLICIGLPGQNIYDAFIDEPTHKDYESLCELSVEQAEAIAAKAWTTRWTMGTADANVAHVQAEGMKAFCWTLDDPNFIQDFVNRGHFDGILSNYPSIVSYYFYMQE